jgi:hypothetical protein
MKKVKTAFAKKMHEVRKAESWDNKLSDALVDLAIEVDLEARSRPPMYPLSAELRHALSIVTKLVHGQE